MAFSLPNSPNPLKNNKAHFYDADVAGGVLAGLRTVWYNVDGKPDRDGFGVRSVSDFRDLLEELK